jgi:hypothetical protein
MARRRYPMDAEISAMAEISKALDPLDADARARVLQWAGAKYSVRLGSPPLGEHRGGGKDGSAQDSSQQAQTEGLHFDTFAELYAAANPSTDPHKVLVAAYWHQIVKGQRELKSAPLNKDLTNLGHRITHINHKFDLLISSKPQLALQLKKSGSTRQARKKYKLTAAGIAKVQGMLSD